MLTDPLGLHQFKHNRPLGLDYECEQVTTDQGRYYVTPEGFKYPSVSTVVSLLNEKAIAEWKQRVGPEHAARVSQVAASRGTDVHLACELFLTNKLSRMQMVGLMPSTKELFLKVKPYLQKFIHEVWCVEQSLYSTQLCAAGKTDAAGIWDGVPSIIDFKTSSKYKREDYILNYFLQCTMYALMFKERTGQAIEQFVIVIAVEEEREPQIFKKSIHSFVPQVDPLVKQYWTRHASLLA